MRTHEVHSNGVVEVFDAKRYGKGSVYTCGTCRRSWDDEVVTGITPTPSARCPFEYDHKGTGVYEVVLKIRVEAGTPEDAEEMIRDSLLYRWEEAADEIEEEIGSYDVFMGAAEERRQ